MKFKKKKRKERERERERERRNTCILTFARKKLFYYYCGHIQFSKGFGKF